MCSDPQTVKTSQTLLDISSYSSEVFDHFVVSVTAHVGQETSESLFVEFTYSTDYYDGKTHRCKSSECNFIIEMLVMYNIQWEL